jgi:hypothetical protein
MEQIKMKMKRRDFIASSSLAVMGAGLINNEIYGSISDLPEPDDIRSYLEKILYTKDEVDAWFAGRAFPPVSPTVWAEGIVIRLLQEKIELLLSNENFNNGRVSFKAINPEFLLKYGG